MPPPTAKAVQAILAGTFPSTDQALLQILQCEKQTSANRAEVLSMILSDGTHSLRALTPVTKEIMKQRPDLLVILIQKWSFITIDPNNRFMYLFGYTVPEQGTQRTQYGAIAAPTFTQRTFPAPTTAASNVSSSSVLPRNAVQSFLNQSRESLYGHPDLQQPIPIRMLNNSSNNCWCIEARVTSVDPAKKIQSKRQVGSDFIVGSVILTDDEGQRINAQCWGMEAFRVIAKFVKGKKYRIAGGAVKVASARNKAINDYELNLDETTSIIEIADTGNEKIGMRPVRALSALNLMNKNAPISVLAIVNSLGGVFSDHNKTTGRPYVKRDLVLVDESSCTTTATLWGEAASSPMEGLETDAVVLLDGIVSDFGGKSLTVQSLTVLNDEKKFTPELAEKVQALQKWKSALTDTDRLQFRALTAERADKVDMKLQSFPFMTMDEVERRQLGDNGAREFFSIRARIDSFATDVQNGGKGPWIPRCPNAKPFEAGHKIATTHLGTKVCSKCSTLSAPVRHEYHVWMNLKEDHSVKTLGTSMSGEDATILFTDTAGQPVPVEKLVQMREEGDPEYTVVIQNARNKTGLFKISVSRKKIPSGPYTKDWKVHGIDELKDYVAPSTATAAHRHHPDTVGALYDSYSAGYGAAEAGSTAAPATNDFDVSGFEL